jgi:fumarylacetoacetate (FAA) hydrolase
LVEDGVLPLSKLLADKTGLSVLDAISPETKAQIQEAAESYTGDPLPLESLRLLAPVPRPRSLRDFYAFEGHVRTMRKRRGLEVPEEWYEFPAFYYSNHTSIYSPGEDIPFPSYTSMLDYEMELAVVITGKGQDLTKESARELIGGYMFMNDWSARDIQQKEMKIGLGPAKAKDFAKSFGPFLVTPDEFGSGGLEGRPAIEVEARVNGKTYSKGNTKEMHYTFAEMIAHASKDVTIDTGDIMGSGTVGGGCIAEIGPDITGWLKPGDIVELVGPKLGTLMNRVGQRRSLE